MANCSPLLFPPSRWLPGVIQRKKEYSFLGFIFSGSLILALTGCSGGSDVQGTVRFDGQLIPEGTITLRPEGEEGFDNLFQATIVDGEYTIESIQPGNYTVAIRATRKSGQVAPEPGVTEREDRYVQYIPVIYNSRTTLTAEIAGNLDGLDFVLEEVSKQQKRGRK